MITDEQIKSVFLRHGFKLSNEAGDDLKPYVYAAARELIALAAAPEAAPDGRWYNADDIDSLVRELDFLLNKEGAAKQAMLCDIVAQIKKQMASPEVPARAGSEA